MPVFTDQTLKIIATTTGVITAIIAMITIIKGYIEFRLSGVQKRIELFDKLINKFKDNDSFNRMINLIENNDDKLLHLSRSEKFLYVGFFEEVALLVNSGILQSKNAEYMFGYCAKTCWRNDKFWHGLNRDGIYWTVFREFVEQMEIMEKREMTISLNKRIKFKI